MEEISCQKKKICDLKRTGGKLCCRTVPGRGFCGRYCQGDQCCKGGRIALEHYYSSCCPDEVFRQIFQGYRKVLNERRKLDFDDMLLSCYELLKKRKDILSAWQKKFHYILVDEFQDINHLQYDIVKMLAAPENNLFVVGDDDQSIYHFRGARPEIMLNFPEDFKMRRR